MIFFDSFIIDLWNEQITIGVFSQMPFEKDNLIQYGDVIFFDSTSVSNVNQWLTIPIIIIDQWRHIQSGGVFFIASETEDVFIWILNTIYTIIIIEGR